MLTLLTLLTLLATTLVTTLVTVPPRGMPSPLTSWSSPGGSTFVMVWLTVSALVLPFTTHDDAVVASPVTIGSPASSPLRVSTLALI